MKKLLTLVGVFALILWSVNAFADDCVDVELGAQVVSGSPLNILQLFFSIENCGTEPGLAKLTIALEKDGMPVGTGIASLFLAAGQNITKELELPILPIIPAGSYKLCVTAELGSASDTACATVTLNSSGQVLSFSPDDPNPDDRALSWGSFKAAYK